MMEGHNRLCIRTGTNHGTFENGNGSLNSIICRDILDYRGKYWLIKASAPWTVMKE